MMRQRQENSRYPFREHLHADWTLEHIHAKSERPLTYDDLKEMASFLSIEIVKKGKVNNEAKSEEEIVEEINLKFQELNTKGLYGLGSVKLVYEIKDDLKELHFSDGKVIHGIGNLALLGHNSNSTFNNKLFLEKREILALWEKGERENETVKNAGFGNVEFVPMATRMVFFKHFSPQITYPFLWTEMDSENYINAIVKTLVKEFSFSEASLTGQDSLAQGVTK